MANIILPERFEEKLKLNQTLEGIVKTTLGDFGDILQENKLYFFEEYTDHGKRHIESVLNAADNLIPDNTYQLLTVEDIGYFILSVILHDIGMHISLDGFNCLLDGEFDDVRQNLFDKHSWKELWNEYFSEAKRFNGDELNSIFGDEKTLIIEPNFSNKDSINGIQKKLVGEFLRRHHARLAHEIALKGFPGRPEYLQFGDKLDIHKKNLIGLIARSHGIDLRDSVNQIENIFGKPSRKFPLNTHAVYLMILLRISDYIQIDIQRISKTIIKIKTFSSPVSQFEHDSHLAVETLDISNQDDPERILVQAYPKDSLMFLKLKKLINDIQFEFDISWAVLGELYGQERKKLEIKYRRIISNLTDEEFINTQNYVCDSFSLKTNEEIIKLLIEPLYGNDVRYGVRELLQNSVDACLEMEKISFSNYEPNLKIEIINEDENSFFIITDNGIGMNPEIIKKYLLTAGASYRKSKEWEGVYLNEEGKSIVRRSGRFGVGLLAGFLIGDDMSVQTKKYDEEFGYKFSIHHDSRNINILKAKSIKNGTQIKIKIFEHVLKDFNPEIDSIYSLNETKWFEWFRLEKPKIEYYYFGKKLESDFEKVPDYKSTKDFKWGSIDYKGYDKILWSYDKTLGFDNICNGFVIKNEKDFFRKGSIKLESIQIPSLSIFDSNAVTPLTLNRNDFSSLLPFKEPLKKDILKDFIASLLTFKVKTKIYENEIKLRYDKIKHPCQKSYYPKKYQFENYDYTDLSTIDSFFFRKDGFILNYNYFLKKFSEINVILFEKFNSKVINANVNIKEKFAYMIFSKPKNFYNMTQECIYGTENKFFQVVQPFITYFNKTKYINNSVVYLIPETYLKSKGRRWNKYEYGISLSPDIITQKVLKDNVENIDLIRQYQLKCEQEGDILLNKLLMEYIGDDCIIPYSIEERREKFPSAFKDLEKYMKKYIKF
ncbi:MAG: ATP-binding protein [Ignavibacteria bacterium]|nr:ATP-binding protein [Ignavibacteria bacterium]